MLNRFCILLGLSAIALTSSSAIARETEGRSVSISSDVLGSRTVTIGRGAIQPITQRIPRGAVVVLRGSDEIWGYIEVYGHRWKIPASTYRALEQSLTRGS